MTEKLDICPECGDEITKEDYDHKVVVVVDTVAVHDGPCFENYSKSKESFLENRDAFLDD